MHYCYADAVRKLSRRPHKALNFAYFVLHMFLAVDISIRSHETPRKGFFCGHAPFGSLRPSVHKPAPKPAQAMRIITQIG